MSKPISRRAFLKSAVGVAGLTGGAWFLANFGGKALVAPTRTYPGQLLGPSAALGHQLRTQTPFPEPQKIVETQVAIVGGGISGLSAAWWLQKHGINDFKLLELEKSVGGNAQSGKNAITPYPWGAHYIPLPGKDAVWVRQLFEELGVIQGYDAAGLPLYDELYLCHDPQERLLKQGRWQEGLVPQLGLSASDTQQVAAFFAQMRQFKHAVGTDGKRAFTIPLAESSADAIYRNLDRLSMGDWLQKKGLTAAPLRWYVDYCCRDDYGATAEFVSAWAGIHYFASRLGLAGNAEPNAVLTWPEGNGWIVNRLKEKLSGNLNGNAMVYAVDSNLEHVTVDFIDTQTQQSCRIQAQYVVMAVPRFIAAHIVGPLQEAAPEYLSALNYAPWLVANVSLQHPPDAPNGKGAPLSWDNVSYHSPALGYVVATHQEIRRYPGKTVLTYYWPLSHLAPKNARKEALGRTHDDWAQLIAADLKRMHPSIDPLIENIDVWLWGHGMIRPSVDYVWGEARQQMQESIGNGRIHFAHSDMSGVSIFEEAQYQGVQAARKILTSLETR